MTPTMGSIHGQDVRPVALLADGGRVRRRQRRPAEEKVGIGATLSATFLGMLMIQGMGHAGEGVALPDSGGHAPGGAAGAGQGESMLGGSFGQAGSSHHVVALGSGLALGGLDAAALTNIAATSGFADGVSMSAAGAFDGAGAVAGAPGDGADGTVRIDMQMASAAAEPVAEIELPNGAEPDPDLGTVGENHTGGNGNDTIIGTDGDDNLVGGGGDDLIYGGNGNDKLAGNEGDDELHGDAGDDELDGGTGNDKLYGGTGNDLGYGGSGNDSVYGGADNDELYGGDGNDLVDGGNGIDEMYGGDGRDRLVVDHLHDLALEDPFGPEGGGIDTLIIRDGFAASVAQEMPHASPAGRVSFALGDSALGGVPSGSERYVQQVHTFIENVSLTGSVAHDLLGDGRDNRLIGNDGDNRIYGGAGDDWLDGGMGDDWLQGGDGDDMMYGSGGDDMFVLGLQESGVDRIFDHSGVNTVSLRGASESRLQVSLDGDDLKIAYDGRDIAVIDQYVGHEANFAGLDLGQGVRPFADLLADYLPQRVGSAGADILNAADGGEWLVGKGGNDNLTGSSAGDRLEGGDGSDVLKGGGGDDTYLISKGETGVDRISDGQGHNTVELTGHDGSAIGGFMLGNDLWITADAQPVAIIEGHGIQPGSFAGVKVGERLVDPNELAS